MSATVLDEVWLWAENTSASAVQLTVEFGGTTAPDQNIIVTIPAKAGLTLVIPGLPLTGNGSAGLTVSAFAATGNVITISGFVNRITL